MGHNWQHSPILVLIRDLKSSSAYTPEVLRHVLNWIDDFRENVSDDPIAHATAALVCDAYATRAQLAYTCRKTTPTAEGAAQVLKMRIDADLHLLKCLRIGGFRANKGKQTKKGLPTAPTRSSARANSVNRDLPPDLAHDETEANVGDEAVATTA